MAARNDIQTIARTKIARLRVTRGITQKAMADALAVSLSTYQRYERGLFGNEINLRALMNIAILLHVPVDDLIENEWRRWSPPRASTAGSQEPRLMGRGPDDAGKRLNAREDDMATFDDFIQELEAEAQAEGPDAVAELEALDAHFKEGAQLLRRCRELHPPPHARRRRSWIEAAWQQRTGVLGFDRRVTGLLERRRGDCASKET